MTEEGETIDRMESIREMLEKDTDKERRAKRMARDLETAPARDNLRLAYIYAAECEGMRATPENEALYLSGLAEILGRSAE